MGRTSAHRAAFTECFPRTAMLIGEVAEREDPAIAADLVSRACLGERIS